MPPFAANSAALPSIRKVLLDQFVNGDASIGSTAINSRWGVFWGA